MTTTVQKWGKSLALRIPSEVARRAALANGDAVELKVLNGSLTIRATPASRSFKKIDPPASWEKPSRKVESKRPKKLTKTQLERMRSTIGRGKNALRGKTSAQWIEWLRGPVDLP